MKLLKETLIGIGTLFSYIAMGTLIGAVIYIIASVIIRALE